MAGTAVGVLKGLLIKADDSNLALLNYRNSPRADGIPSTASRMLKRSIRTLIPKATMSIMNAHDPNTYKKLKQSKEVQKQYYN